VSRACLARLRFRFDAACPRLRFRFDARLSRARGPAVTSALTPARPARAGSP